MKKKSFVVWVIIATLFCFTVNAAETEITLKNEDNYYYENIECAIEPGDSHFFDISYRVCDIQATEQVVDYAHAIHYDLVLRNLSGVTLEDLRFTAHFKLPLQTVLSTPEWYNEPITLFCSDSGKLPNAAIYTWEPLVLVDDLDSVYSIELSDFYDMIIEIEWREGSEVIRLSQSSARISDDVRNALTDFEPLTESIIPAK